MTFCMIVLQPLSIRATTREHTREHTREQTNIIHVHVHTGRALTKDRKRKIQDPRQDRKEIKPIHSPTLNAINGKFVFQGSKYDPKIQLTF